MPPRPFNPENAVIYKICCKDENVKEIYVGSSVNFNKRKSSHKSDCNNENSLKYNYNVYKYIRENGGWANFNIIIIENVNDCIDLKALHKKEREYIELLNASLNRVIPTRTIKEWVKDNEKSIKGYHKYYRENNKELTKEYYEINKDELSIKHKEYYKKNKEEINQKHKEFVENNKEKIKQYQNEYNKAYLEKNKDEINQKRREKYALKKSQSIQA